MRKRFGRPSPALAISLIALFVAMGGTSYGLARNSIDSREIKNNDVRTQDIRNNTVRSTDVRNGSLLSKDFKSGQLPAGPRGATGPGGPAGPGGLTGSTGQQGVPGLSNLQQVSATSPSNSTSPKAATVFCPAGKRVVGTGADLGGDFTDGNLPNTTQQVGITNIDPDPTNVSVLAVEAVGGTPDNYTVTAHAICANVAP